MSNLLKQIKLSVKAKTLDEAFKSDDKTSEVPDVVFDKSKSYPSKHDMKKAEEADYGASKTSKITAGKDKAKSDNDKDIKHKKITKVIGEAFGKPEEDEIDDDDVKDPDDANGEPKEVSIPKPSDSDSDDDNDDDDGGKSVDGDNEVDIKIRKVTKEDVNVEEHLAALLGNESLSEEFQKRVKNIFEAAVIDAANSVVSEMVSELIEKQEAEQEEFVEAIVEKMDDYLDKVVTEWLDENRVEVQTNVRTEIAESFLSGLKTLFEDHYIDIPDEKIDIVEELVRKVEMLESSLDEEINRNVSLENELVESRKEALIAEHFDGLSENQQERLRMLAESIDLKSETEFASQIEDLKESYFGGVKSVSVDHDTDPVLLNEETVTKRSHPVGSAIAAAMSKNSRKI